VTASNLPVTRGDVERAAIRIGPHVRATPILQPGPAAFGLDRRVEVVLKAELLQHTGSFKPRGATNRVLQAEVPEAGLAAASGGNHGQAVAWVAQRLGLPATVFVPHSSSPVKQQRIAGYGAGLRVEGAQYDDAQRACRAFIAATGALGVHPYDDLDVVAGQGTVALELARQAPGLDTVLVAVGGGGLIAGAAAYFAGTGTRVIGVEPQTSCCLAAALLAGRPVPVDVAGVAADSLGARQLGDVAWAVARSAVAGSLTVADEAIRAAQRALWDECRLAAEPGGAAALAALLSGAYRPRPGERVGVVICGGNVDLATLAT
jgi:threonine dehydratase